MRLLWHLEDNVSVVRADKIRCPLSIVIATSKRAREIIGGDEPLVNGMEGEKPLSIAVKELYDSKIKILPGDEENMEDEEHLSNEEFEELGEVDPAFTNVE